MEATKVRYYQPAFVASVVKTHNLNEHEHRAVIAQGVQLV